MKVIPDLTALSVRSVIQVIGVHRGKAVIRIRHLDLTLSDQGLMGIGLVTIVKVAAPTLSIIHN